MKNKLHSAASAIGICALAALACVFLVFVITFKDEKSAADDEDSSPVTYLSESAIDIVKDDGNIIFSNATEDLLESELDLKRMINYIKPLMSIFLRKNQRQKKYLVPSEKDKTFYNQDKNLMMEEATRSLQRRNKRKRKPSEGSTVLLLVPERRMDARYDYDYGDDFDRYGIGEDFGEYVLASGGGGGSYSCCKNNRLDLIPLVALLALAGLLLYYITVTTTTTASSGRKRRKVNTHKASSNEEEDTDYQDINCNQEILNSVLIYLKNLMYLFKLDLMDAPMWLSMVDELWNSNNDQYCGLETLCRMNRLALESPGTTGLAISLSR